ncbi:hypothetical protein QRX60_36745 [Amycolatopsis mongoliensis]|uniref:Uncharacterized protein n=1 Tax=Amycolatopsis mongoliensis TaxID=715475 RepID=A0A9Y2NIX2_9PSEU|nr:hypothetical protein [Amycolatopsis sp. 4-36]WIX99564.1 hypothetical protein QRX60_36745 [Amycolatopsis sp. 4-36]
MWPAFPHALATSAFVVVVACLAVRFALPVVLRTLVEPVRETISLVAAVLVLPEFWISRTRRRDGGTPSPFAYAYGDGIARLACVGDRSVVLVLRSLARAAVAVHPIVVGLLAIVWQVVTAV